MNQDQRDSIMKNFQILMKECDTFTLSRKLIEKNVLTSDEVTNIFTGDDEKHNKRKFLFNIQKKPYSFYKLLDSLRETQQYGLADLLDRKHTGCVPFRMPNVVEDEDVIETEEEIGATAAAYLNNNTVPLEIKVVPSDRFYDNEDLYNKNLECYHTRSKNKGLVLIINNYDFSLSIDHDYRTGAEVDGRNLKQLFEQMCFKVEMHVNKTAEEIKLIINDFREYSPEKVSDMCFVIIMSHGGEWANETHIYGKDNNTVNTSWIEEQFNNQNCRLFREKPKVILYQVCRGLYLDGAIRRTKTDSISLSSRKQPTVPSMRTTEDMLIGHSTLPGYKAHRDVILGTWYIELICEIFMNHAHDTPIDDMLLLVDQRLRKRMSEKHTMQTSEASNRGFKKCFIHPGIYEEDGVMKSY